MYYLSAKDSKLLNYIVEYYMAVQSERSLDILVRVKDPHDKVIISFVFIVLILNVIICKLKIADKF